MLDAYGHLYQYAESSARVKGHRLVRVPAFAMRIQELQKLHNTPHYAPTEDLPEPEPIEMSRSGMVALMGEVTETLAHAIRALEHAGGSPKAIANLRSDLVLHIGRLDRLDPPKIETSQPAHQFDAALSATDAAFPLCDGPADEQKAPQSAPEGD